MQHTQWQMEPDLASAPPSILESPEPAVATMTETAVADHRGATAATAIIETPVPLAFRLSSVELSKSGTTLGAVMLVMRAQKSSRWVIAIMMMMNQDPHVKDSTK